MKRELEYWEAPNKNTKITLHKGCVPTYNSIEQLFANFIELNRKALNPNTTWCIDIEMFRLIPKLKEVKYKTILQWIYRFLIRHNYTYRRHTHVGQSLPKEAFNLIAKFVFNCYNSRLSIIYDDEVIVNMN